MKMDDSQDLGVGMTLDKEITDLYAPFSSYNMAQGSTILVMGGLVTFESDKPTECMTLSFKKG